MRQNRPGALFEPWAYPLPPPSALIDQLGVVWLSYLSGQGSAQMVLEDYQAESGRDLAGWMGYAAPYESFSQGAVVNHREAEEALHHGGDVSYFHASDGQVNGEGHGSGYLEGYTPYINQADLGGGCGDGYGCCGQSNPNGEAMDYHHEGDGIGAGLMEDPDYDMIPSIRAIYSHP